MKRFLNNPDNYVIEMLDGLLKAHPDQLTCVANDPHCIVRANAPTRSKVALATGGGSGHLPVFLGYVGAGLLDGCAVGDVFASPNIEQVLAVTHGIHAGMGVLYIYGNYGGDIMNFDMAADLAAIHGIETRTILVTDDVASAADQKRRRGVAGMVFAFKIAGACAERGDTLDAVEQTTRRALDNIRTMGVALSPCTVPAAGRPTFTIGDNDMEIGMGIHGEPGVERGPLQPADAIAENILTTILADLTLQPGDQLAVMVNGLGATPPEDLYILYRRIHDLLHNRSVSIYRAYVGEYATSMEMAGASISLFKLDSELAELLDYPASSPFFVQK